MFVALMSPCDLSCWSPPTVEPNSRHLPVVATQQLRQLRIHVIQVAVKFALVRPARVLPRPAAGEVIGMRPVEVGMIEEEFLAPASRTLRQAV